MKLLFAYLAVGISVTAIGLGLSLASNGLKAQTAPVGYGLVQSFTGTAKFAEIPACNSKTEGLSAAISDSMNNGWGVVVTGNGLFHVLAYCDGTNWRVSAR